MDLGLRGKTALVCAASKRLGKGCAAGLAAEGVELVITARGRDALDATAAELRNRYRVNVIAVAGDITTPEGRAAALAACPAPDILVTNAGGPPPGRFGTPDEFGRGLRVPVQRPGGLHHRPKPVGRWRRLSGDVLGRC